MRAVVEREVEIRIAIDVIDPDPFGSFGMQWIRLVSAESATDSGRHEVGQLFRQGGRFRRVLGGPILLASEQSYRSLRS